MDLEGTKVKAGRRRRIVQLIKEKPITNQNELVKLLRTAGFAATQATVSRDLDELGAIKVRRNGKVAYSLPADAQQVPSGDVLRRLLTESLVGIESSGNLIVIRTHPGHAHMVASAIDHSDVEGVAGTVAGDDTILVVAKQGVLARRVEKRLRSLAGAMKL